MLASYAFDNLGRRTSVTFGNGSTQSFAYDAVSRLSTLANDLNGGTTTHDLTQSFTYNPASQIASAARGNDAYAWGGHYNVDRSYTANGRNQLTAAGGTALGYDARGNLTSSGSSSYGYDSDNRLTHAQGALQYVYDPIGRLKASNNINWFVYDGVNLIAEVDPVGTTTRRYVHGPGIDNPIIWYEGSAINNSTRRFLIADERGSIVSITDSAGATVGLNRYDEYGIPAAGNVGRFGYTGQTWLAEVGLWYYKARMYSPTLGRFMQTDPIGYGDGMNWYDYVDSDPVNFADSLGLAEDCAVGDTSCEITVDATKKANAPATAAGGVNIGARGGNGPGANDGGPNSGTNTNDEPPGVSIKKVPVGSTCIHGGKSGCIIREKNGRTYYDEGYKRKMCQVHSESTNTAGKGGLLATVIGVIPGAGIGSSITGSILGTLSLTGPPPWCSVGVNQ